MDNKSFLGGLHYTSARDADMLPDEGGFPLGVGRGREPIALEVSNLSDLAIGQDNQILSALLVVRTPRCSLISVLGHKICNILQILDFLA
jgi:hypothetical protein